MEAERQRSNLETFADLARKIDSQIMIAGSRPDPQVQSGLTNGATPVPESRPVPKFFQRLFGRIGPEAESRSEQGSSPTHRLADSVIGLEEYKDGYPIIWHRVNAALPTLDESIRERARLLEAETIGLAQQVVCAEGNCLLLTVKPFQTRDKVQIMVVEAGSLRESLAGIAWASGVNLSLISSETAAASDADANIWTFEDRIADIPIDAPGFAIRFELASGASNVPHLWNRYVAIAAVGILITLTLLFLIHRPVLRRVDKLAQALPKLPEGEFDSARALLAKESGRRALQDETTDLIRTTGQIIAQIDTMQGRLHRQTDELRLERDQMQSLLDTIPAAVFLLGNKSVIESGNKVASDLLQMEPRALSGRMITHFLSQSHHKAFMLASRVTDGANEKSVHEFELQDTQGGKHLLEWHMVPLSAEGPRKLLAVAMDLTPLRESERRLTWLRSHDETTQLLNRRALTERLSTRREPGTLLLIRPSNEDALAETLEFPEREQVLQQLSAWLKNLLPEHEASALAYLGKFRFAVLLAANRETVEPRLSDLEQQIEDVDVNTGSRMLSLDLHVSGLELGPPDPGESAQDQIDALEKLSNTQTSTVQWLGQDMLDQRQNEHYHLWADRLQAAFRENRFVLYFQPVYDSNSLQPLHSEVLVRLQSEDGQIITPDQFLRVAEQSAQMRRLDRYIFDSAVEKALSLQAKGIRHPLAINVSAPELMEPYLLELLQDAVETRGLRKGSIMIELVETHAIGSLGIAIDQLERFRELGVPILLDDFGIGFTSFEYLRELPFEYVKIDRTFVRDLVNRTDDRRLIRSIHEMVSGLRRRSIAEGVEDFGTYDILRRIGIDAVQGFGLTRPGPEICLAPADPSGGKLDLKASRRKVKTT